MPSPLCNALDAAARCEKIDDGNHREDPICVGVKGEMGFVMFAAPVLVGQPDQSIQGFLRANFVFQSVRFVRFVGFVGFERDGYLGLEG